MKTVLVAAVMAALCVSACATPQTEATEISAASPQRGADPAEVEASFVTTSAEICGRYFESDLDIDRLASTAGVELKPLTAGSRYPGGIVTGMPVYQADDGIVHLKENLLGAGCEVLAYGIPVQSSLDEIALRLETQGFVEDSPKPTDDLVFMRSLTKEIEDVTVRAVLNGNEPGAAGTMSRFSTLAVTFTLEDE